MFSVRSYDMFVLRKFRIVNVVYFAAARFVKSFLLAAFDSFYKYTDVSICYIFKLVKILHICIDPPQRGLWYLALFLQQPIWP